MNELAYWYWLESIKGLGPLRIKRLLNLFENNLESIYALDREQVFSVKGIDDKIADEFISAKTRLDQLSKLAEGQLKLAKDIGAHILHYLNPSYPMKLLKTSACPPLLYARGNLTKAPNDAPAISVVGTRKPTVAGLMAAERIGTLLGKKGWTVVSGLAEGVDSAAHRGTLDAAGTTIAVLGCGVDIVYPSSGRELFERIIHAGLLVSEHKFGTRPSELNLKKRNKITVGLSDAVVVVETGETGGTWNAIRAAAEQKKKVFVLQPENPESPSTKGNLKLLHQGDCIPFSIGNAEDTLSRELLA